MRTFIQKFGKSLMAPLSMIIAAGLMLGIASLLTNRMIFGDVLAQIGAVNAFINLVNSLAGALFSLLPILFCLSLAIGMTREDKETAAFAGVIGFVLFHTTISFFLSMGGVTAGSMTLEALQKAGMSLSQATSANALYETVLGVFTYRMGVFGGIIVGLWTALIHNRFHTAQLPAAFSFFSGIRFVPIMETVSVPLLAIAALFTWPYLSMLINVFSGVIQSAGAFGTFMYGFSERLLIPTGLHHILNQLIRFTPVGGTAIIGGEPASGALNIFNALLMQSSPNMDTMRAATRFLTQGTHPFMVFGLPAACYAMYRTALPQNKKKVKGMLLTAALTCFITGITEPIEFAFIFISPMLWVFHALMAGLSFLLSTLLGICIGNAGGGLIDLTIFGILRGPQTRWYLTVLIGIFYAVIYYHVFKFVILKRNLKTPGRDTASSTTAHAAEPVDAESLGEAIMNALGGRTNIIDVDNCISRLRLVLVDTARIDEDELKATGSLGIIKIDEQNVQVVYGNKVERVAHKLRAAVRSIDIELSQVRDKAHQAL